MSRQYKYNLYHLDAKRRWRYIWCVSFALVNVCERRGKEWARARHDLSLCSLTYRAKNVRNQIRPTGPERLPRDPLAQLTEILFIFTYDRAGDKETPVIFHVFICGRVCLEVLAGRARPPYRNVLHPGPCLICEISSPRASERPQPR